MVDCDFPFWKCRARAFNHDIAIISVRSVNKMYLFTFLCAIDKDNLNDKLAQFYGIEICYTV